MINEQDSKSINALKGIAILGIVLVHYGINTGSDIINSIVANGARGVQLMFVLNAYLIFNSLSKIEMDKGNIIKWYKKRFIRLIPLYWFFTILHLLIFGVGERYWLGSLNKVSILNIACNLLFLHGFNPYYINSINANWFMADLAIFYLLAPFLYKIINSLEKAIAYLLTTTVLGYILWHFMLMFDVLSVKSIWIDYVTILSFFSEFPVILLGVLVYFIRGKNYEIKNKNIFSKIILAFAMFSMISLILNKDYFVIFNNIFSFGVLLALILISQLIYPSKLINNFIFITFGKHSYGIYLSHLFIIPLTKKILGGGYNASLVGYVIVIMVALAVSIISEKLIERPILRLIKKH